MIIDDEIGIKNMLIPLHIISQCGGEFSGKTRLQKLVFLSQESSNKKFNFDFKPAPFGPLSYKLNHAIERMKRIGLLKEKIEQTQSGNTVICYSITEDGKEIVNLGLNKLLTPEIVNATTTTVTKYGNMSYVDLLDYVHTEYPEYLSE